MTEPGQTTERIVTAALLAIGDEVLSGRTRDANIQSAAKALGAIGVDLMEARVVRDDADAIVAAVNALRARWDHVLTCGGIGPTHDDITAEAVARAFGVGCAIRDDARGILEAHYGDRLNAARLRMARIPDGATLIPNPVTAAPGFHIGTVWVMAGVPSVFNAMLDHVCATLQGGSRMLEDGLDAPAPEGELSAPLAEVAARHPAVSIGSYPRMRAEGGWGVSVVARARDRAALDAAMADLREAMAGIPPREGD